MYNAGLEKASVYRFLRIWCHKLIEKASSLEWKYEYELRAGTSSRWPDTAFDPAPTHLIRQKKDFSCMQSGGDDSEMGRETF